MTLGNVKNTICDTEGLLMAKIYFDPLKQSNLTNVAIDISERISKIMPKVPWLSASGHVSAYYETCRMILNEVEKVDADSDARNGIQFWTLTLLYANNKKFQIAATTSKRKNEILGDKISNSWIMWIGIDQNPALKILETYQVWNPESNKK